MSDEQANDENKARVARAHRSDRAKLAVTSKFGGIFFDATAILVERFDTIVSNVAPVDVEKAFEESGEFAEIWGSFLEERALSYFVPEFRHAEAADTRAIEEEKVAAPAFQGQDKFPGKEVNIKPMTLTRHVISPIANQECKTQAGLLRTMVQRCSFFFFGPAVGLDAIGVVFSDEIHPCSAT